MIGYNEYKGRYNITSHDQMARASQFEMEYSRVSYMFDSWLNDSKNGLQNESPGRFALACKQSIKVISDLGLLLTKRFLALASSICSIDPFHRLPVLPYYLSRGFVLVIRRSSYI